MVVFFCTQYILVYMTFLDRVCQCLEKHEVPYAIVGGFAVALHGLPRGTFDIDLIVRFTESDFMNLESALKTIGLVSRLPVTAKEVYQFREEYIQNRNLIAWSFVNPSNPIESLDVIITTDLKSVSHIKKKIHGHEITVIAKKDLIAMKKTAGRAQDLADIKALESL